MTTKQELVAECETRGLRSDGTKQDLLERIQDFDEASEAVDAADDDALIAEGAVVASQELAVIEERVAAPREVAVLPSPGEWEATMVMARTIAATTFVPKAYRGNPEAVVAGILYGREIGLGPMQALQKVHIIDGKPSLAAEEMLAQMRRGGVVILASESTRERAVIHARRSDTGEEATVEWTIGDAVEAGLTGKDNWAKYATDMLWARCVGRLARRLGSDLLGGIVYAAEEMADWDDGGYGGSGFETELREPDPALVTDWRAKGFNPALSLDQNAPKGWEQITQLILDLDRVLATWVAAAVQALYGAESVKEIGSDELRTQAGRRIANTIGRIRDELYADGDFPPATDEEYRRVFAWGFDGVQLTEVGVDEVLEEGEVVEEGEIVEPGASSDTETASEQVEGQESLLEQEGGSQSVPDPERDNQG